ncbi:MAG: hypothetical protein EOO99_08600 [Pedobacter sp.]|nr:MAG: hypothetical protein EOO99_08600 [Pedobacter sp.]
MLNNKVSREYAFILAKYLKKYDLETIDIAYLINSSRSAIDGLLLGNKTAVLHTLEAIAQCFGLSYYEFGNPNHPLPHLNELPSKTLQRIKFRKKEGPYRRTQNNRREINAQIKQILTNYKVDQKFLIEDIQKAIISEFKVRYQISEIMDRIRKSFSNYIIKTDEKFTDKVGRGAKPNYMLIIKEINLD